MGVLDVLARHATTRRRREAIVSTSATLDYAALRAAVAAAIDALARENVTPDDVVGLTVTDEAAHLILSLALLGLGTAQVTLASHDSAEVRSNVAVRARVTRALTDEDVVRILATTRDETGSHPGGDVGRLYLRTSGTTGGFTIVALTEDDIAAQASRHADYRDERLLRLASIEHNNSKRHRLYCVWAGGTNVFRPPGDLDVVDYCLEQRVTCLDVARIHAADLVANPDAHRLSGIKVRTGGSDVPYSIRRAVEQQVTASLFVRYAATECGGIAMAGPGEHDEDESVGRPLAGVTVEIVDERDAPVARGAVGHVRVRAPGMATGYLDSPEASAERHRNGWFYPGDLGFLRSDGSLVVRGRADDMIIFNGLNIFPVEIEQVLQDHPDVRTAVGLGLPSRVHGQIPVAVVQPSPGATVDPRDLVRYCRPRLALKTPRRIVLVDSLPLSPQFKISRRDLLALFERE